MRIFYRIIRKKKPFLVFIHGLGCNHTVWRHYFDYFEKKSYSTLAVDLRSHGKSPSGNISYENFANDIISVLKKEKIKCPIIITHCFGIDIAVELSKKYRCKKFIFINPFTSKTINFNLVWYFFSGFMVNILKNLKPKTRKFQNYGKYKNESALIFPFIDLRGTSALTYFQTLSETFNYRLNINDIKKKTLIMLGEKDLLVSVRKSLIFFNKKNIKIKLIKGADHLMTVRAPNVALDLIEKFIISED